MEDNNMFESFPKYGLLVNDDIKLQRNYFSEMTKLIGINVIYRSPKPSKTYTTYAEIDSSYNKPILVGCIFDEHPNQYTMKKLGWLSEINTEAVLISVPYDLEGLQKGAIFIVPSGIDNAEGRLFMVDEMFTTMIYPSSVTCRLVPLYKDTNTPQQKNFTHSNFNLLNTEGDEK